MTILLVDGNNVVGATADGWWRDRPGAMRRLLARLQCLASRGAAIEVVFDVPQADLPAGRHDGVVVHYATRRGRDAADERILELLDEGFATPVEVVTSDRAGVRERGATVLGAGGFLARLDAEGC